MSSLPELLRARESGTVGEIPPPPTPNAGALVLDGSILKLRPNLLNQIDEPVHYVDLGAVAARSLSDFGGSDAFWGGIKKLYACNCQLESLDGINKLTSITYLYLDGNNLCEYELLRLCDELPPGCRLKALDVRGNPGWSDAVGHVLLVDSDVLREGEFLNGQRLISDMREIDEILGFGQHR